MTVAEGSPMRVWWWEAEEGGARVAQWHEAAISCWCGPTIGPYRLKDDHRPIWEHHLVKDDPQHPVEALP